MGRNAIRVVESIYEQKKSLQPAPPHTATLYNTTYKVGSLPRQISYWVYNDICCEFAMSELLKTIRSPTTTIVSKPYGYNINVYFI